MCESRSATPVRAFDSFASFFSTPEMTLKYVTRPAKASATVLKTKTRNRLGILDGAFDFLAVEGSLPGPAIGGAGEIVDGEVENQIVADVVKTGGAQHRSDAAAADAFAQAVENMFDRQRAFFEKFLKQRVVAFRHHFDERFVALLRGVGQVGGDFAFLALPVAVVCVGVGLHADQVDHAFEFALGADGEMDREWRCGRRLIATFSRVRSKLERSRSSLLMMMARGSTNSSVKVHTFSVWTSTPATPSTSTRAASAATRRAASVVDENVEAGRVDQVDLLLVPLGGGNAGGDGDFALNLLFVEIGDGGALIDAGEAIGGAAGKQEAGDERRFSGMAVSYEADVPDVVGFVNFHWRELLWFD